MNDAIRKGPRQWRMGTALACALILCAPALANEADSKFKDMDTNGDGAVSATEHAAGASKMFREMDANGDGNVTAAEMETKHAAKKSKSAKAKEPMTSNEAAMDHARHDMSASDKLAQLDTNGDGMLSAAEHDAGAKTKFAEMDTDGNGSLSRQEMAKGHAAMKSDKATRTP